MRGIQLKQDDFDPKIITEAIGIQRLSSPELTAHADKPVRALVAMALFRGRLRPRWFPRSSFSC